MVIVTSPVLLLSEMLFISVKISALFPVVSIVQSDASFKVISDALVRVLFDITLAAVVEVNTKGDELLEILVAA